MIPMTYTKCGLPRNYVLILKRDGKESINLARYFHRSMAKYWASCLNKYAGYKARVEKVA